MAKSESYSAQVDRQISDLTKPLREQLRGIERRLVEIDEETKDLRASRRRIEHVLRQLDPSSFVSKSAKPKNSITPAHVGSAETMQLKREALINYLNENAQYYVEHGIVAAMVYRDMKEDKVEPVMSPSLVLEFIRELHANGVLRADRRVKGGAMLYQFAGGGDGKA